MKIKHTDPSRTFVATGGGAGLNPDFPCGHGTSAVSLHLTSHIGNTSDDIGVIIPRCATAALIGAALAYIEATDGQAAADDFLEDMNKARDEASREIKALLANHEAAAAACCEAGYFTQGREHTCQDATTQ